MNDFDRIAWCYEPLKQLVFGDKLEEASRYHFNSIRSGSTVLILGGGTGKILSYLPSGIQITYLEKSERMLHLAKRRIHSEVTFIHADFPECSLTGNFDYVLCPFFLDVFDNETLKSVIEKITKALKTGGRLIVTDFAHEKHPLTRLMYLFFRIASQIQANRLPEIHHRLVESGFKLTNTGSFQRGFLFSNCYEKLEST